MEPEREDYEGHRAARGCERELLIDNVPALYGQMSDRLYFMHEYAYCWHDYLMDLARANLGDRLRSIIRAAGACRT